MSYIPNDKSLWRALCQRQLFSLLWVGECSRKITECKYQEDEIASSFAVNDSCIDSYHNHLTLQTFCYNCIMDEKKYTEKELAYISKLMADGLDRKHAEWYLKIMQTVRNDDFKKHEELFGDEYRKGSPKKHLH